MLYREVRINEAQLDAAIDFLFEESKKYLDAAEAHANTIEVWAANMATAKMSILLARLIMIMRDTKQGD